MKIINKLLLFYFKKRLSKIANFEKTPGEIQQKTFFFLLKKSQKTLWGQKYVYQDILESKNFSEALKKFQKNIPLYYYDDFKPWIEKVRKGEKNIIWPGRIKMFSKSSGTTSDKSKFLPVTKRALKNCHFAGGQDAFAMYLKNNPKSKLFSGKILGLVGSLKEDELNSKNDCGDISAIILRHLPTWIQKMRVPKFKTSLMSEWEAKLKAIIEDSKNENVVALAGAPSWMLVLLQKMEQITGRKIKELWPNLEVMFYGGMSMTPYLEQYKNIIGPDLKYIETYGASEGLFGANADSDKNDLLLMLDYEIFYEFVPLEKLNEENPPALFLSEVELDKNYALVISSSAGLWRYVLGDTIKFTSLKPYRFIISGRTKSFINVFGEELMESNASQALIDTCKQTNTIVKEYCVAPVFMTTDQKGAHEWLIEFEKEPEDLESFRETLDINLQKINSDYEAKRYKDMTLEKLKISVARSGLFMDWLAAKNKLGGQNKVPKLFNDRNVFEEIVKLNY